MKKHTRILLMTMLLIAAGTIALQAQVRYGRGTGACINYSSLNEEQKATLDQLRTEHIAQMDAMRTQMRSTADQSEWIDLRTEKDMLLIKHRAEVDKFLTEAGATIYRPGRGVATMGAGRGAGMVAPGRGAGRFCPAGAGMGAGRGMGRRFM